MKNELEEQALDIIKKLGTEVQIQEYKNYVDIDENHYNGLLPDFYTRGFFIFFGKPFRLINEKKYRIDIIYLTIHPGNYSNLHCNSGSWYIENVFTKEYIEKSGMLRTAIINDLLKLKSTQKGAF